MVRSVLLLILVGCGSKAAPAPPRPADYGQQVVTDMKAFADRECQCAEKVDDACSKRNIAERQSYYDRIDRSRPFSGDENLAIDDAEKRFRDCAKQLEPVILE